MRALAELGWIYDEREVRAVVQRAVGGALFNVSNFPECVQSRLPGQNMGPLNEKITDAVLDTLGRAHTPTDDEREAARVLHLDARQAAMQQDRVDWFPEYDREPIVAHDAFVRGWDAAVDGRFRRPEEPHGEPSDAQRRALARSQRRIHREHAPHFHLGQCKCGAPLGDSIDWHWHLTGVALRAAGGVR